MDKALEAGCCAYNAAWAAATNIDATTVSGIRRDSVSAAITGYLAALPATDTSGLVERLRERAKIERGNPITDPDPDLAEQIDEAADRIESLEREVAAADSTFVSWRSRAQKAEARLAEAEAVIRRFAEGNLGDAKWQANYERIRSVARSYLEGRK